jgi:hypothetical protein
VSHIVSQGDRTSHMIELGQVFSGRGMKYVPHIGGFPSQKVAYVPHIVSFPILLGTFGRERVFPTRSPLCLVPKGEKLCAAHSEVSKAESCLCAA